ncbi:MAG: hypothetical protein IID45_00300 [Planctomycetes bacterium]|nr:hypothetical protein [Planctomycetota bacterium]
MPIMNCNTFERTLQEALEKRISADGEELRRHADACAECAGLLAENAVLAEAIPLWNARVPAVDLTDAVLTRWNGMRRETVPVADRHADAGAIVSGTSKPIETVVSAPRPAATSRSRIAFVAVVAVFLFLAAVPFLFERTSTPPANGVSQQQTGSNSNARVNRRETRSKKIIVVEQSHDDLDHLIGDVGTAYLGLADEMRETFTDAADLLPFPQFGKGEPQGEKTNGPSFPAALSADWSRGLKPIGRKVEQAFGFLLDAIPRKRPANL